MEIRALSTMQHARLSKRHAGSISLPFMCRSKKRKKKIYRIAFSDASVIVMKSRKSKGYVRYSRYRLYWFLTSVRLYHNHVHVHVHNLLDCVPRYFKKRKKEKKEKALSYLQRSIEITRSFSEQSPLRHHPTT